MVIRNSRFAKFHRVSHICKSGTVIPGTAYDTRWANQFHLRGTVAEHRRRQHSPLPENITKSSMWNPRRNEGMQMQLRNIATRFRVLVSLSLSTACYLKNRIRRAFTFSRAFFLSFRMPCLPANNTYIVLCIYIYTKCLRIITSEYQEYYINQEILRNLYIKNYI